MTIVLNIAVIALGFLVWWFDRTVVALTAETRAIIQATKEYRESVDRYRQSIDAYRQSIDALSNLLERTSHK